MNEINEALIVGTYLNGRDSDVLTVGRQNHGNVNIINAFSGDRARYVYDVLTDEQHINKMEDEVRRLIGTYGLDKVKEALNKLKEQYDKA